MDEWTDGQIQIDRRETSPLLPHLTEGHFSDPCGNPTAGVKLWGQMSFYWWKSQLSDLSLSLSLCSQAVSLAKDTVCL